MNNRMLFIESGEEEKSEKEMVTQAMEEVEICEHVNLF